MQVIERDNQPLLTLIEPQQPDLIQLQNTLKRYCLSLTESPWDAEDLVQATWLKAISHIFNQGHRNPEALLLRVAKNTWIDHTRRQNVLSRLLKAEKPKSAHHDEPDQGLGGIESIFQALTKHLSPLQRAVFLLRDVFGYTCTETAEWLHTTEGAVKAALHRARQSLHAVQEDLENNNLPFPVDEGFQAYLRIVAGAYRAGNLTVLIELVQRNEMEPAMAIGIVQHAKLQRNHGTGTGPSTPSTPSLRMAA